MGDLWSLDLDVIYNEDFGDRLPHDHRSRAPELVESSEFSACIHITMLGG
jgi:hypothetical protein